MALTTPEQQKSYQNGLEKRIQAAANNTHYWTDGDQDLADLSMSDTATPEQLEELHEKAQRAFADKYPFQGAITSGRLSGGFKTGFVAPNQSNNKKASKK